MKEEDSKTTYTKNLLTEIKQYIEDENLSFIIGAGFSKNISPKYPTWEELLTPMIKQLYPKQFNFIFTKKQNKKRVLKILDEIGYLNIASEYVRRKGYHEAIDIYIENNTPYLEFLKNNNKYVVLQNGKIIDDNPSVECHKKLLKLNAKHIFTFNYDNTLDVVADVKKTEELKNRKNEATKKLIKCENLLQEYKDLFKSIKSHSVLYNSNSKEKLVSTEGYKYLNINHNDISEKFQNLNIKFKNIENDDNNINEIYKLNIKNIKNEIPSQNNIIDDCKVKISELYQLITKASDISITDSCKNIYKLHGTLRIPSTKKNEFGFDGDNNMHYVITKEDYDAYPLKHEAFVNLMKISLLKGAFCLIGFSGDDPNFKAWISWVKDIIDKGDNNFLESSKIYFINAGNKPLDDSKLQLLKNHYIKVVNLFELFPDKTSPNGLINAFLDYFHSNNELYKIYDENWEKIKLSPDNFNILNLEDSINIIYKISKSNIIPCQFGLNHNNRIKILSFIKKNIKTNKEFELYSKLIFSAIKGELLPLDFILTEKEFKIFSSKSKDLKKQYLKLYNRSLILRGKEIKVKDIEYGDLKYEEILHYLFNLNFTEAEQLLENWNTTTHFDEIRKYILFNFIKCKFKTNDIKELLNKNDFQCLQDYKFALDIFYYMVDKSDENFKSFLSVPFY